VPRTATVRAREAGRLYSLDRATFLLALTGKTSVDHAPERAAAHVEDLMTSDSGAMPLDEPGTT